MTEIVDIKLQTYNKSQFNKVVNTQFNELGVEPETSPNPEDTITVTQFFNAYNRLFLEIPKQGQDNSHQYLANTSGEYAGGEDINAEIEALTAEVTQLREENIALQQQVVQLGTKTAADAINVTDSIDIGL